MPQASFLKQDTTKIALREYQRAARDAILGEWKKGNLDTLAALSTGTGKTEIFLSVLAADLGPDDRAIIVAHRQELIYQPRDRILHHWPMLGTPGVVMADQNECDAQVVIATIQTLCSNGRLDKIIGHGKVTHLITDEAHHSVAPTYKDLYARLREHNPKLKHLGVTATPRRTDGDGLSQVYQSVAYRQGIKESIKQGALCPFMALGFRLPVNIEHVRTVGEGWDDEELGDVLKAHNAEELIVTKWAEHAENQPTICFTASVAQAYSLAERFREHGYAFEAADGTTKQEDRAAILSRFQNSKTTGIVNCALWTEGFDAPKASCLVQVRPTRSDLVYVQMVGRVLRKHPSKQTALILDFVPDGARDLVQAGDLLGKPKEQREIEEKAEEQGVILGAFGINSKGEGIDGDPDQIVVEVLDYLTTSRLAWTYDGTLASATVGEAGSLAITMPDETAQARLAKADELKTTEYWQPSFEKEYERVLQKASFSLYHVVKYRADLVGAYDSWDEATEAAEDFCDRQGIDVLGKKSSKWRSAAASDKQRALCEKLGIWQDGMSKGQAAQAITHVFARQALKSVL